jgi:hypothetical protein
MKQPKNAGKAPSMQWYPADWRKDTAVQMLSFHDRGVWFELINIMHESSERGVLVINGAPMPEDALSRLLGLDKQTFNQTLSNLLTYGVAKQRGEDGAIYCKRMVEDEKLSQLRRNAGKLGGNPNLVNQNPTTRVNQNPTPSSSTSTSTSPSGNIPPTPKGDLLELDSEMAPAPKAPRQPKTDHGQRIHSLFHRGPRASWSDKELKALRKLEPFDAEDFALVESYYRTSGNAFLRTEVQTFLNNYQGEVDKARLWRKPVTVSSIESQYGPIINRWTQSPS